MASRQLRLLLAYLIMFLAGLVPASLYLEAGHRFRLFTTEDAAAYAGELSALIVAATLGLAAVAGTRAAQALYLAVAGSFIGLGALGRLVLHVYPAARSDALPSLLYVLLDSNPAEGFEFLAHYASWADLPIAACLLAVLWLTWRLPLAIAAFEPKRRQRRVAVATAAAGLALGLATGNPPAGPIKPLLRASRQYRHDLALMREEAGDLATVPGRVQRRAAFERIPEVLVLVLGESTTRHNMGIYGYGRDTTPRLTALAPSLLVFRDVIAPHAHTIPVLQQIFTFSTHERPDDWRTTPDLLTLFRRAGFKSWWISNQQVFGRYESWITAFASKADQPVFMNVWQTDPRAGFDGVLLDPFRGALADPALKKLVVVHLLGTHLDAARRCPPEFRHFDEASAFASSYRSDLSAADRRAVDAYDNAVRYSDHVVAELLQSTMDLSASQEALGTRVAFLYVSDHGDEVKHIDGFVGHSELRPSRFMFEVPMIAWLSPRLRREIEVAPTVLATRPYQTDRLIHSLLDLMGVDTDRLDSRDSIFSARFRPRRRVVVNNDYDVWRATPGAGGRIGDPTVAGERETEVDAEAARSPPTPKRVPARWLHRTNSTEKLTALFDRYDGFEVDVVFDAASRCFDVNHPPAPSIGLDLEWFFGSQPRIAEKSFWLDVKNLDDGNAAAALAEIVRLREAFALHGTVIIESTRVDLLTDFTAAGFETSYYLPQLTRFASPTDWVTAIRAALSTAAVTSISTEDAQYQILNEQWDIDRDVLTWSARDLDRLMSDPRVRVVLVPERTTFDR